jgi:2-oxo-3-hexenedioate decarboxylase
LGNGSSSGFVAGNWFRKETDVTNLGLVLSIDGRPQQIGSTAAISGNPVRALVAAARVVASAGEVLAPGDIVLAGGATAAVALAPGMAVDTCFETLGTVAFNVGDQPCRLSKLP